MKVLFSLKLMTFLSILMLEVRCVRMGSSVRLELFQEHKYQVQSLCDLLPCQSDDVKIVII